MKNDILDERRIIVESDMYIPILDNIYKKYCDFSHEQFALSPQIYLAQMELGIETLEACISPPEMRHPDSTIKWGTLAEVLNAEEDDFRGYPIQVVLHRDRLLTRAKNRLNFLEKIGKPIKRTGSKIRWMGTQKQLILLIEGLNDLGFIMEKHFHKAAADHFYDGKKDKNYNNRHLSSVVGEIDANREERIDNLKQFFI